MFYNFRKNKKAFTLVELIVVIAILAILATVVGVSVTSYIDKSRKSTVEANASSLMTVIQAWVAMPGADLYATIKTDWKGDVYAIGTTVSAADAGIASRSFYVNTGKYYVVVSLAAGAVTKAATVESKPAGTYSKV